jgi:tetratricopeptide (TPR) repeat protein
MYYLWGHTDEAIAQLLRILELDADLGVAHSSLGKAYVAKKMFDRAINEFRKGRSVDENSVLLAHASALAGKTEQAMLVLGKLLDLSARRYTDPYGIALIYAGLGQKDKAFAWFDKAFEARSEELLFLKVEPVFDSLRDDPRYQALVRRIGLTP